MDRSSTTCASGGTTQPWSAVDGIDGLETLRAVTDLALALCDLNMPRMNGLDMIAEVQRTGPKIPILMLTTEGQPSLIRRAREAGAKGWIVKPFKQPSCWSPQ